MKLTNNLGLPQPVFDAIANEIYDRGSSDITVTELISPPRLVALKCAHDDELEEDISDLIYSLFGQAIHTILERANREDFVEKRLYTDVLGWKVGGQFDRMTVEGGVLADWKTAKVDELRYGIKAEREHQLNCLAHLARANGHEITKLEATFLLRDWSKVRAAKDSSYPQVGMVTVELPLWSPIEAQAYIEERVRLHQEAYHSYQHAFDSALDLDPTWNVSRIALQDVLPECSPEERWAKPDVYAVMKQGRKSAVKLCDWEAEAQAYVNELGADKHYIQHRPGESLRCAFYCAAAAVCEQAKAMKPEPEAEPFE